MAKAVTKPARGTRDFLPADIRRREHVLGIIREVYRSYGFEPLETPAIERLETLTGKYGDEGDQLLFKILNRGQPLVKGIREASAHIQEDGALIIGRSGEVAPGADKILASLGLRYDLTVPLARVVANCQGKLPSVWKRYQIQPVWRADSPGKGRFREFYQCDVDVVGSQSRLVEAEVLGAVAQCLKKLGFEQFSIRINHRRLLTAVLQICGVPDELEVPAIIAIDKLDKIGPEGVAKVLAAKGIDAAASEKLLALLAEQPSLEQLAERFGDHPLGLEAVRDLQAIFGLCASTSAHDVLDFQVTLARGLGYYTGAIFEIAVADLAGSLGGGGRYDQLIGMFSGKDVPACGFAIGVERVIVVMEQRGMLPAPTKDVDVVVAAADKPRLCDALQLANELRAAGMRVELWPQTMKPGKLRQYADAGGIGHAVWLQNNPADDVLCWSRSNPDERSTTVARGELLTWLRG